jgi:hypothetical protein
MRPAIVHAVCGGLALVLIAAFFLATIASELFGSLEQVVWVKTWIVDLIPVLVVLMAGAGALGNLAGRGRKAREVARKRMRMALIAGNGVFILIPCALVLESWAIAEEFTGRFYTVQVIELLAGAANMYLIALNIRDGRRLARHT